MQDNDSVIQKIMGRGDVRFKPVSMRGMDYRPSRLINSFQVQVTKRKNRHINIIILIIMSLIILILDNLEKPSSVNAKCTSKIPL